MREIQPEPCVKSAHEEPSVNPQKNPHSERARGLSALFAEIIEASPPSILKFYDRGEAIEALEALERAGVDVTDLPNALRRMAADAAWKSRKHPPQLHVWLRDRQFEGWPEQPALALDAPKGAAPPAPVDPAWATMAARLRVELSEDAFSYVASARLGEAGGQAYFVAFSRIGADRVRDRCWRKVQAAWAEADPARRPLNLVSKLEFEQLAGAAQGSV